MPRHTYLITGSGSGSSGGVLGARGLEFMVSRKAVDSLGLIMSGGLCRDDQVIDPSHIAILHFLNRLSPLPHTQTQQDLFCLLVFRPYLNLAPTLTEDVLEFLRFAHLHLCETGPITLYIL